MKIPSWVIHCSNKVLSKTLFNLWDPESWHKILITKLDVLERIDFLLNLIWDSLFLEDPSLETDIWNMHFKNPVWIAAGFVKLPYWLKFLEKSWVWYITIWWITKESQTWNNRQRIYKFWNDIVNWMWLPWDWWEKVVEMFQKRIKSWLMPNVPIIANLCNSAKTPEEEKADEFLFLMEKLHDYVDAFEINVSCPNQCWVTNMQQEEKLTKLLTKVNEFNEKLALQNNCERKTILVKIAPLSKNLDKPELIKDLTIEWLEIIANVCNNVWIDWVTATNTSQEHNYNTKIITPTWWIINWWLSWLWLKEQSLKTVKLLRKKLNKTIPIIWSGGIWYDKWQSWVDMINAWATSIEILSSLVQNSVVVPYYLKNAILESKNNQYFRI
jgi:dihydroorotate dehydrogenase